MARNQRVRVDIKSGRLGERDTSGTVGAILDMLRYSGLLESNVPNFPNVIEYEVPAYVDAAGLVARWFSFGFMAEVIGPA